VYENIVVISHHWPGITPFNVWQLPYDMWLGYVAACGELKDKNIGWWSTPLL